MVEMAFGNPVEGHVGPPGHLDGVRSPVGAPPPDHRLASGNWCFRVTQTFASTTGYYKGVPHGALDLGNYRCGDRVLAMAAGRAYAGVDSAGALYVIIDHGNGWVTRYWHLKAWVTVRRGVWTTVGRGQQIGVVGDTGLGAVCHLHVETAYRGVKRDPWPLLAQNQEDELYHVPNDRFQLFTADAVALQGARVRAAPNLQGAIMETLAAGDKLRIVGQVRGEAVNGDETWFMALLRMNGWAVGYLHASTVTAIEHVLSGVRETALEDARKELRATAGATLTEVLGHFNNARMALSKLVEDLK